GVADVRLLDGRTKRIHLAAYRLKHSRWVWVVVVPDERVESLVRALLACFEASGGVPLRVVFDNPKTVVLGRNENGRPRWNPTLAQAAIDYGFTIELCTPRSPEQKGAVENLVGWVKKSFFRARRFADLEHDLPRQLVEWLTEGNEQRPWRATGVIPAERLAAERQRMKLPRRRSRRVRPALSRPGGAHRDGGVPGYPLRHGRRVRAATRPRCTSTPTACGSRLPAAASSRPIRASPRGRTSYLAGQRAEQLAAVAGARKRLYFMRERILELGPVGEGYLTELIHARPHTWKADVERLFALPEEVGEALFLRLLQRALFQRLYGAEYVVRIAAEVAS
ncbi:MAG TPA: DDE-type integrase/transposase/recombinase, partial [Longimicrobiaceae bacterium]|nr:DDE-type integrase/transposase/recombinase [Longimicrobiaceae bacterium]